MQSNIRGYRTSFVSLFTREWIEINTTTSYRLKINSLPLYEGVDWNISWLRGKLPRWKSPSLRGSGLKFHFTYDAIYCLLSPSLRGSGLKYICIPKCCFRNVVSLFTREWIEIKICTVFWVMKPVSLFTREWIEISAGIWAKYGDSSPSLRGSGLKSTIAQDLIVAVPSPSLRGSGLKFDLLEFHIVKPWVSLFTREWIEIL